MKIKTSTEIEDTRYLIIDKLKDGDSLLEYQNYINKKWVAVDDVEKMIIEEFAFAGLNDDYEARLLFKTILQKLKGEWMILDTLNKEQEDFLNSCYQLFLEQQQKQNKKKP